MIDAKEYLYRVALPLDEKLFLTQQRIKDFVSWCLEHDFLPTVSFSGGIYSTVLLEIVRDMYPWTPALFSNTGLEFPEVVSFARSKDCVCEVKPKVPFHNVIEQYGWPVVSKKVAMQVRVIRENNPRRQASIRCYLDGVNREGKSVPRWKLPNKWRKLLTAPFKVSEKCCDCLKKEPLHTFEKANHTGHITGVMATDSEQRRESYLRLGCNSYNLTGRDPRSNPMSFWTKDDVWNFVRAHGIKYASVYDMGYTKTGCIFCGFGAHMDATPNRFQLLRLTHPKQWDYVMNRLGMAEVLGYIGVPIQ